MKVVTIYQACHIVNLITLRYLLQAKIKERCRKGIPPAVRGKVWQYLTGAKYLKEKNPGVYQVEECQSYIICVI